MRGLKVNNPWIEGLKRGILVIKERRSSLDIPAGISIIQI